MTQGLKAFQKRLKRIDKLQNSGVFSAKRRAVKIYKPLRLPVFHLLMFFGVSYGGLTGAKIYFEQKMGADGYEAHLTQLAQGNEAARVAAKLLQQDRFTAFVKAKI